MAKENTGAQNTDSGKKKEKQKFTLEKEDVLKFMVLMLLFGVILIFLYAIKKVDGGDSFNPERIFDVLRTSSIGIIIGGASLMIGAFMGFLFGIPKALQGGAIAATAQTNVSPGNSNGGGAVASSAGKSTQSVSISSPPVAPPPTSTNGARTGFQHNDNLVEISDWLTKIIVGVGLTQLNSIPARLNELGIALGVSFGADPPGQVFSVSTVLFFLTDGFLLSYLWTRLYFIKLLNDVEGELEKAKDSKKELTKELEDTRDALATTGRAQNQNYKKKFIDKNDPQKGLWGGLSQNNGYKLEAHVDPIRTSTSSASSWFKVLLRVTGTDDTKTLTGVVTFYLHPSFGDVKREVPVLEGKAELPLVAYGAFTVGAQTSDGTKLELDLSQLPGAPTEFRER